MKRIVMMQGMGLNERGWAGLVSNYGPVLLIQQGYIDHVERWENGRCVFSSPEINVAKTRYFDNLTFGSLIMFRNLRAFLKFARGEKVDLIIAASYSPALVALFLRCSGRAGKVVCTVVDHLPLKGSLGLRIHRRVAGALTYFTARFADEVWAISPRIPAMRFNRESHVIPFVIDDNGLAPGERTEVGYIGFPTPDHALDLLFAVCRKHDLRLNIIGDSPYLRSIKELAPPQTVFHGQLNDKEKIKAIFSRCFCGYAVYRATGSQSHSYYGFPSKSLYCFANNTPLLTTNTSYFTQEVEKLGIGRVVEPTLEQIEGAILDLRARFPDYYAAINRFRQTWNASVIQFHRERLGALLPPPAPASSAPVP